MGYAKYVGRVGGLAVALGIGAAVAGAPTAWADDSAGGSKSASDSASSSSLGGENTSSRSSESDSKESKSAARETSRDDTDDSAGADDSESGESDASADTDAAEDGDTQETEESAEAEETDETQESVPGSEILENPVVTESDVDIDDELSPESQKSEKTVVAESVSRSGEVAEQDLGNRVATDEATAAAAAPAVPSMMMNAVTTADVPVDLPAQLFQMVGNAMQALINPIVTPIPTTPDSSPLLVMLEWWRRTAVGMFYNRTPGANPLQIGEAADGTVIGTIGAIDPDGDPLTYSLAEGPKFGTVVVNADGTFEYTPGDLLAADGGNDTFLVTVHDNGIRLLSQPGITTASVSVTVGAGDALGIGGQPYGVAMSVDRRRAYVTDVDNHRVVVLDVASRSVISSIEVGAAPYGIAVASDGRAYVVNSDDGTLSVIDTETNTVLPYTIHVGNSPTSVAVNSAGTRVVVTASNDDSVAVVDTQTMEATWVKVGDGAFGVAISDNRAFVTNEFDDTVSVIDLGTNTVVRTIAVGNAPTGVAIGGNRLVVTNSGSLSAAGDGSVSIIDLATLDVVGVPVVLGEMPTSVVVDANGEFAYVTDAGKGTVTVLDLAAGQIAGPILDTAIGATGLDIGFDGKLYVAGIHAGTIDILTPATAAVGSVTTPTDMPVREAISVAGARASMLAAADAPASSTWTRGFDVFNLTTETVTLVGYEGDDRPAGTVPLGIPVPPGGKLHFEVPLYYFSRVSVRPIFKSTVTEDTWTVRLQTNFDLVYAQDAVYVRHTGTGTGTSSPSPQDWTVTLGHQVSLLEARDTIIPIETLDPKRNEWVNKLCNGGGAVSCYPTNITRIQRSWSEYELGSAEGLPAVDNNFSSTAKTFDKEVTASWSTKASFEGSVKLSLSLSKVLSADLAAKIGQEVTNSANYKLKVTYTTPAWKKVTVLVRMPTIRVTSDLFITVGNTTVQLKNVTYELPNTRAGMEYNTIETDATNPNVEI